MSQQIFFSTSTAMLASLGLLACGAATGDAGSGDGDAGAAMTAELPPLEAYEEASTAFVATTADLSCLGTRTRPAGGDLFDVEFQLRDFPDRHEVVDATVWLFADNVIGDSCEGLCQAFTTDAMGNARVRLPAGGWYAYRVLPKDGPTMRTSLFGVFQYNEPAPLSPNQSVVGSSVSESTLNLIPALLGITREPGRAILSGRVTDCLDEHNLANVEVRVFDPDGNYVMPGAGSTDPHYHYFMGLVSGNVPDQAARNTSADGLYVVPQLPLVDDRPYRVEAWANLDGVVQRISCETARLFTDSVTILNLGPTRADVHASCQ